MVVGGYAWWGMVIWGLLTAFCGFGGLLCFRVCWNDEPSMPMLLIGAALLSVAVASFWTLVLRMKLEWKRMGG